MRNNVEKLIMIKIPMILAGFVSVAVITGCAESCTQDLLAQILLSTFLRTGWDQVLCDKQKVLLQNIGSIASLKMKRKRVGKLLGK